MRARCFTKARDHKPALQPFHVYVYSSQRRRPPQQPLWRCALQIAMQASTLHFATRCFHSLCALASTLQCAQMLLCAHCSARRAHLCAGARRACANRLLKYAQPTYWVRAICSHMSQFETHMFAHCNLLDHRTGCIRQAHFRCACYWLTRSLACLQCYRHRGCSLAPFHLTHLLLIRVGVAISESVGAIDCRTWPPAILAKEATACQPGPLAIYHLAV